MNKKDLDGEGGKEKWVQYLDKAMEILDENDRVRQELAKTMTKIKETLGCSDESSLDEVSSSNQLSVTTNNINCRSISAVDDKTHNSSMFSSRYISTKKKDAKCWSSTPKT